MILRAAGLRVLLSVLLLAGPSLFSRDLEIHFINLGHSDCSLVRTPNGAEILIDAGLGIMSFKLKRYLRHLGIRRLDILLVTHPDPDHYGGAKAVVKAFEVKEFVHPGIPSSSSSYNSLLKTVREKGIPCTVARKGKKFIFGETTLEVLWPGEKLLRQVRAFDNANSLVLRLTYASFRALFAADIEAETETLLVRSGAPLKARLLKMPHHGISTSNTAAFLEAVSPKYAVITCAYYAEPARDLLDRLSGLGVTWFRTDANGTIVFRIREKEPHVLSVSVGRGRKNSRLKVAPDWYKLLKQTEKQVEKLSSRGRKLWDNHLYDRA